MDKKEGFVLRNVCGEHFIISEGPTNVDFSKLVSMNESSAYLWQKLPNKGFSVDDAVKLLQEEYNVDYATASKDVEIVFAKWQKAGIIE